MAPTEGFDLEEVITSILDESASQPKTVALSVPEHASILASLCASEGRSSLLLIAPGTVAERLSSLTRALLEGGPNPRLFPKWPDFGASPYEPVVPGPFLVAGRLGLLGQLALSPIPAAITMTASQACLKVIPFDRFLEGSLRLETHKMIDLGALCDHLVRAGYRREDMVSEVGDFSVRGGILDLFSPILEDPVRVELDGDEVVSIRVFDAISQRTIRPIDSLWVVPAWDVPTDPKDLRLAGIRLRDLASRRNISAQEVAKVEHEITMGRLPPGFYGMLATWHGTLSLILDYLPEDAIVFVVDPPRCEEEAETALDALRDEYSSAKDGKCLIDEPEALRATFSSFLEALEKRPRTVLVEVHKDKGLFGPQSELQVFLDMTLASLRDLPVSERVHKVTGFIKDAIEKGYRLLLTCPTKEEVSRVREVLEAQGFEAGLASSNLISEFFRPTSPLSLGLSRLKGPFIVESLGLIVIPSEAVFGLKDTLGLSRQRKKASHFLKDLREIEPGALVIHREHGLGRFEGVKEVTLADGTVTDCLSIIYHGGDRLFVPVEKANLIERYIAPPDSSNRPLDRLGSPLFERKKKKARKAAREIAGKLKEIYARRLSSKAWACPPPGPDFREFEATFPYETTPDQEAAIAEVIQDLCRETPMDRLVCGDVGFGKTEVAIRAAYLTAMAGKQVAVLVPTTLLAEQHRLTFSARFRNTPIVVESLSRLKSKNDIKRILEGLRKGRIDVVIGTHRLLSKDVEFRDLGLLVIDEEHRFGVEQKERIREMAASVHTLSLSATPIPRTLHMALSGIRDMSIIATPPKDRLAVKTVVARFSKDLVRAAILRELSRGGQVFVVHNRIEDIYDFARTISEFVPEARVTVAHGQMSANELESVMTAFLRGEKDVLVCTAIIQSGLDIATANTMLIHEAASFGLADLYQLRGRVGRASEQAYCYLLVNDIGSLSEEARRRIEAIERFSDLAGGFHIATMDLEIRGPGNVFGAEQSGHIEAVGYDMFVEMVSEAIREMLGQEEVVKRPEAEVNMAVEARIPASYVPSDVLRLRFYRRLASCKDLSEVAQIASEMRDRYGRPPVQVENLLAVIRIRVLASDLGVASVRRRGREVEVLGAYGFEEGLEALSLVAAEAGFSKVTRPSTHTLVAKGPPVEALLAATERWLHMASEWSKREVRRACGA